jgi:hypothetical protein
VIGARSLPVYFRHALSLAVLAAFAGCGEEQVPAPKFSPQAAAAKALQDLDANQDQLLESKELEPAPGLAALLKTGDTNGDGKLDAAEIRGRIGQFVSDNVAYLPVRFHVFLDGQPLDNAKVQLLPEPCLQEAVVSAEGVTNAEGIAAPLTDKPELGGVQCGIYRISISKQEGGTELIPSHYNQKTTLGLELWLGNREAERPIVLQLSSTAPAS